MKVPAQAEGRQLTVKELAFFTAPRAWPEIMSRFGAIHAEIRDGIILADCDGGFGFLLWRQASKTWTLTDKGRNWVTAMGSARLLKEAAKWVPPEVPYPARIGNKPGPKPKVKPSTDSANPLIEAIIEHDELLTELAKLDEQLAAEHPELFAPTLTFPPSDIFGDDD